MKPVDWNKAPEGATHFLPEQPARGWVPCWYKNVGGIWWARNTHDCDWFPDNDYVEIFIPLLVERQKPWSGEGLPPVGTVCEYRSDRWPEELWEKRTVRYISDFHVITAEEDGIERSVPAEIAQFRPIRTPEQIAADKRLHEIRNALTTIKAGQQPFPNDLVRGNITLSVVEAMIDAGYRKEVKS